MPDPVASRLLLPVGHPQLLSWPSYVKALSWNHAMWQRPTDHLAWHKKVVCTRCTSESNTEMMNAYKQLAYAVRIWQQSFTSSSLMWNKVYAQDSVRPTGLVRTILPSRVRTTMHCSFLTCTRSPLTSSIWSMKTSSGFVLPDSGCNSNLFGYNLAYRVCHAEANGPPNFLIYPCRMQSDSVPTSKQ